MGQGPRTEGGTQGGGGVREENDGEGVSEERKDGGQRS